MGGNMNFILRQREVWVEVRMMDPLTYFSLKKIEEVGL